MQRKFVTLLLVLLLNTLTDFLFNRLDFHCKNSCTMISPAVTPASDITVQQKPFHRPGFPTEYPTIPSPIERGQSCPTSPSSPCSTASEHDSSLEKTIPTDSDHSDDGEKDAMGTQYYRNPNHDNSGMFYIVCCLFF